ncbi:hypothetical protein [Nocardioides nitrophenolicus]|uniref:hypothetical protein n=1 Tax=Nocardioides nitrophenolicus TaxID=60489 RepID=UPI00195EF0FF|nr:hypothetical protein [Nocardioides nitrophenolicus]MBM7519503.1 hypothetical protein [Nocardioides nitrophenolicus]
MTTTPGYDAWAQRSAAADKPQPNPFKGYKKPKGHSWHKIYRREAYNASVQPDLGLDLRLWFLVVNRAGYNGHAQFPGDSLLEALPKYNRSTGEVSRYSIRALQKVIAEGVRANLYAPTSGPRCIILGAHLVDVDRPPGNWKACRVHHHRFRWNRDVWGDIDGSGHFGPLVDGKIVYPGKERRNSSSASL